MSAVTLVLGAPTDFAAGNWLQWDKRLAPAALGDVSVFSSTPGSNRFLVRIRIFRAGAVQFQVIDNPDGSSGFSSSEELSVAWEQYAAAFTLQVPGLADLVVTGPDSILSTTTDTSEPYQWNNGNSTEQQAFFDAYSANSFLAVATVVIDDGVASAPVDIGWSVRAGNPTVSLAVQAGPDTSPVDIGWSVRAGNPTVSLAVAAIHDITSLLPPNATPLERALEAAIAPRVGVDAIRAAWDPWACPEHLLPWLAWAFSVDYWDDDWSLDQKRRVIALSIEVHRRKGTVGAMRRVVEGLGYGFQMVEWWELVPEGTPGTAEVYLFRESAGRPIANADLILARRLLEDAKRGTLHLTMTPSYQAGSQVYLYVRSDAYTEQRFSYSVGA